MELHSTACLGLKQWFSHLTKTFPEAAESFAPYKNKLFDSKWDSQAASLLITGFGRSAQPAFERSLRLKRSWNDRIIDYLTARFCRRNYQGMVTTLEDTLATLVTKYGEDTVVAAGAKDYVTLVEYAPAIIDGMHHAGFTFKDPAFIGDLLVKTAILYQHNHDTRVASRARPQVTGA